MSESNARNASAVYQLWAARLVWFKIATKQLINMVVFDVLYRVRERTIDNKSLLMSSQVPPWSFACTSWLTQWAGCASASCWRSGSTIASSSPSWCCCLTTTRATSPGQLSSVRVLLFPSVCLFMFNSGFLQQQPSKAEWCQWLSGPLGHVLTSKWICSH